VTPSHEDTTVEDHGSDVHWEGGPHYLTTFLLPEVSPLPHGDTRVEDHGSDVHWEGGPHYLTIFFFQRCLRLMGTLQWKTMGLMYTGRVDHTI
jgi:hypothetical protein